MVNPNDVSARVKIVKAAWRKARDSVTSKIWDSSDEKHAQAALTALFPLISDWGTRGISAAHANKVPAGALSWSAWVRAGEVFQNSFPDIARTRSEPYTLTDIVETSKQTAKSAGKIAAKSIKSVAQTAGSVVGSVTSPLVLPLAIGLGLFLFLRFGRNA